MLNQVRHSTNQGAKVDAEFLKFKDCTIAVVAFTAIDKLGQFCEVQADHLPVVTARASYGSQNKTGKDRAKDLRLMKFLAKEQHTGPFEHFSATFFFEAPLFVVREWQRHRTQSYSEVSMRYVSKPASRFWLPDEWRSAVDPTGNKQGSGEPLSDEVQGLAHNLYTSSCSSQFEAYKLLLDGGVCKEQARAVLPVSMISSVFATANILNWSKFVKLRSAPNAMKEIQLYANAIDEKMKHIYPDAWAALMSNGEEE